MENPDIEAVQGNPGKRDWKIRKEMSSASAMRYTPKLKFKFDAQIDARPSHRRNPVGTGDLVKEANADIHGVLLVR